MLPFMVIELAMYGLVSGLLTKAKIPSIAKLLIAQVSGRAVRAVAITIGFYLLGTKIAPAVIWTSIVTGLPGLALQWIIIPVTMFFINKKAQYE